jgi:hypothetical protein
VFVSSQFYDGNLGGLAGADSKCQSLASAAGLSGTFKAWLSDSSIPASSRLTHAAQPYVLTDGTLVANDWAGLTSASLLHPIDLTEAKQTTAGFPNCSSFVPCAWTYTVASGSAGTDGNDCLDWTSSTPDPVQGWTGDTNATNGDWTGTGLAVWPCESRVSLYCVEQ